MLRECRDIEAAEQAGREIIGAAHGATRLQRAGGT
jgi:hypothetical protein